MPAQTDTAGQNRDAPEKLVMITGGVHSGKSDFALEYAEKRGAAGLYVATSPLSDSYTMDRIVRQRQEREGRGWSSIEVETDLIGALRQAEPGQTVLVDCLSYWINKILLESLREEVLPDEEGLAKLTETFVDEALKRPGLTVTVTTELGLGIPPDNDLARRFRLLLGRVNQVVASNADSAFFIASGLPMRLK